MNEEIEALKERKEKALNNAKKFVSDERKYKAFIQRSKNIESDIQNILEKDSIKNKGRLKVLKTRDNSKKYLKKLKEDTEKFIEPDTLTILKEDSIKNKGQSKVLITRNNCFEYLHCFDKELREDAEKFINAGLHREIILSSQEEKEVTNWINIYNTNNFKKHHNVNNYITENNRWNDFPIMRSLNTHGRHSGIPGILPKYYSVICKRLNISGENGIPLTDALSY